MAAGSREERLVSRPQVPQIRRSCQTPPVLLHGNLHWPPPVSSRHESMSITVFDTVSEVFRLMPCPVSNLNNGFVSNVKLLDMEGVLALSSSWNKSFSDDGPSRVDLWLLEDYNVWVCKYRIELPVGDISRFLGLLDLWTAVVVSHEGDVLVDLMHRLLGYDREGNLLANLPYDFSFLEIGPHMLKRSLVPHASIQMNNHSSHKPPFL